MSDGATGSGQRGTAARGIFPPAGEAGGLVVVKQEPFNAEAPLAALADDPTPVDHFYVRSHFAVPRLDTADWHLEVGGAVAHPVRLSFADIQALPARTLSVTMECAGNDRIGFAPLPKGEPWGPGAVSTGRWRGAGLRDVLDRAGLAPEAVEVLFTSADHGTLEGQTEARSFERSLPRAQALDPDVLLAYELNGAALPPAHGGPVRLLVPGWYGMASVKWLARITGLETPFAGFFQKDRYVLEWPDRAEPEPLGAMPVKALITAPLNGARLDLSCHMITGLAWSGAGPITGVEVSVAGDGPWQRARLLGTPPPYTWQRWEFDWEPARQGRHVLRARATDAAGRRQPDVAPWNRLGYMNNAIGVVIVDVQP